MLIQKSDQFDTNFKVYARIRPFNQEQEKVNSSKCQFLYDSDSITVELKNMDHTFKYDKVYEPETTQEQIFNSVAKNVINNAFEGINSTILCYGQTCSGKTHTIVGDFKSNKIENEGLLPRILKQLLNKRANIIVDELNSSLDVRIKLSMVEIYNEKIVDLLADERVHLKLRENKKKGVFVDNVTEKYISSPQQGMEYVIEGLQQRTVGITNENSTSSRSHMVAIVTVIETDFHKKEARSAKLMLVDLAGSQRLSRAGIQGKMIYQTKKINLSLSTLGKVIVATTDPSARHVPYRDSKLTRLLKESIGGNALTTLIINISPLPSNINQSVSSLRFGARAKMVKNKPRVNKSYTIEELLSMLQKTEEKIRQLVKYIGQLENVIEKNVKNGNLLTEHLRNQGPLLLKTIEDDFDHEEDFQSQTSTSKLSSSQNFLSQTAGSQGFSPIRQLQAAMYKLPTLRKSQSCLNMTAKQFSLDKIYNLQQKILSEKLQKMLYTPKNITCLSTKQQQENDDSGKKSNQKDQGIASMFESINFDSKINKIQQEFNEIIVSTQDTKLQEKIKVKGKNLNLQSQAVDLRIGFKCLQQGLSLNQNLHSKALEFECSQIESNDIKKLYNKSEQKLVKYKAIIKRQDSYISELKQRHKAKKMKLSKEIAQILDLWQVIS